MTAMTTDPSHWKARVRLLLSAVFFFGYLAFHISVPALFLITGWNPNFRWSMFARGGLTMVFSVVTSEGAEVPLDRLRRERNLGHILGKHLDRRRFVPSYLCEHVDGAVAVIIRYPDQRRAEETLPCRR
jgi:hypothetical protein